MKQKDARQTEFTQVLATRRALTALSQTKTATEKLLSHHLEGVNLLSEYVLPDRQKVWVLTQPSGVTFCVKEEYAKLPELETVLIALKA
jgi:hypothetical protein